MRMSSMWSSTASRLSRTLFQPQNVALYRLLPITGTGFQAQIVSHRTLFTDEVLGIDRFVEMRKRIGSQFGRSKSKFLERLDEHLKSENGAILSEDLKNLILLCDNQPEDISLLRKAIQKFEQQNESLRYGTFQFGPVVMRLAHHLNLPDLALMLMEKEYITFYSQLSSVSIALDLLLKNERYDDVIQLFNFAQENYKFDSPYPSDFVTVYMAACYKMNTVETFDQAFRLLRAIKSSSSVVRLRAMTFFLALAVEQNQPNITLEIMQQLNLKTFSTALQSIRLLAFANIDRFHDIADILRYNLKKDKAIVRDKVIFHDTLAKIESKVSESGKKDAIEQIKNLVKNLDESGMIEKSKSLNEALLEPIQYEHRAAKNRMQSNNQRRQPSNSSTTVPVQRKIQTKAL